MKASRLAYAMTLLLTYSDERRIAMDNYMTYLVPDNRMILGENQYFDMDCHKTQLNNNVLVVGASGAGKTRSIVSPNILQAAGSYIIVDPKGSLYGQYKRYLRRKGYCVQKLNFTDPRDSETLTYNFFSYIHNDQDILKIAHMMVHANYTGTGTYKLDPFWDDASELLMAAIHDAWPEIPLRIPPYAG